MGPRAPPETPKECFERLKVSFDTLKDKHTDPWNWHEYLGPEPDEEKDDQDPEIRALRPKKRPNVDRLKVHLMACVSELNRAAHAADMAYFHMCVSPVAMRECCMVLGTSDDIDEDMLESSGDASPAKIMAAMQKRLSDARVKIGQLEDQVMDLQGMLYDEQRLSEERWMNWQGTSMQLEEALTRLNNTTISLEESNDREDEMQDAYEDLTDRFVRASRILVYKGRELLRDKIFKAYAKENLFYAFNGLVFVCTHERNERKRQEELARRDAVEFALRNEVRFMLAEGTRGREALERLVSEAGRLKIDRRELACRLLYKHRPHEALEYLLWIWELWVPMRRSLSLEKDVERERYQHASAVQMLVHTSSQLPPAAAKIDKLREALADACIAKDNARREITALCGNQVARLTDNLFQHRLHEIGLLRRLQEIETEDLRERIAVLEREIAEDTHIQSLKGMVVDLESRLRKALDRRKAKGLVVPPGKVDQKCVQCGRESMFRNWKVMPDALDSPLASEHSIGNLGVGVTRFPSPPPVPPPPGSPPSDADANSATLWSTVSKKATFTAVWR